MIGMNSEKGDYKFKNVVFSTEKQVEDRFRFPRRIISWIIYSLLIIGAVYFVFISNIFTIKHVDAENVRSVEIKDYIHTSLLGKNILFMLPGRYLDELTKEFPVLREVRIVRGLPSTVRIVVDERKQKLIWCNLRECYEVDNYGYAYKKTKKDVSGVVIKDLGDIDINELQQVASKGFISFFINALEKLSKQDIKINEARINETTFRIDFVTHDGWIIIMDTSQSLNNQMSALNQVVENNKSDIHEYVDVRVEGVAYIK